MTYLTVPLSQPLYGASPADAIKRFFTKYATFTGRASRSEYWWTWLAATLAQFLFGILYGISGGATPEVDGTTVVSPLGIVVLSLWVLFNLAVIVPSAAIAVRRLHDANTSGWFLLLVFVGLSVVVFVVLLLPSKPEGIRFDKS